MTAPLSSSTLAPAPLRFGGLEIDVAENARLGKILGALGTAA